MTLQTLTDQLFDPALIERFGWTLFHSVWQLFVLVMLLLIANRVLRKHSANSRYVASCICLLAMICVVPLTFLLVQVTPDAPQQIEQSAVVLAQGSTGARSRGGESIVSEVILNSIGPMGFEDANSPAGESHFSGLPANFPDEVHHQTESAALPVPLNPSSTLPARVVQAIEIRVAGWLNWIVAAWAIGVVVLSFRPLLAWRTIRRLRTQGVSEPPSKVFSVVQQTAEAIGIHRVVKVMQSTLVDVPAVVGWLQPVLLLPASAITGLTIDQLKSVIAHELAHVRRNDYLVNIVQTCVETLFFYHPAVWWVSHHIRTLREDCCDDIAVAMTNDRACYVRALLALDERRSAQPSLALSADGGSLLNRVRRIVSHPDTTTTSAMSPSLIAVVAALILFGSVGFWAPGTTAFSEEPANVPEQVATTENETPQRATEPAESQNTDAEPETATGVDEKEMGTLIGRITFSGERIEQAVLYQQTVQRGDILPSGVMEAWKKNPGLKVYDESVVMGKDKGLANVFVWLTTRDAKLKAVTNQPKPKTVSLSMEGGRFVPHVLAFRTSDQLSVVNRTPKVGNIHTYPRRNPSWNQIVASGGQQISIWQKAETVPFVVKSDFASWMTAYLLPLDHSWFAVTDKTGRFKIDNIPPGDWQVRIWHESCGYVKTNRFTGRFRRDIEAGVNDLGDMTVSPVDLKRIKANVVEVDAGKDAAKTEMSNPVNKSSKRTTTRSLEDDWFWFDPYSELGHVDRNGDGWRFVRLAGHTGAREEIGTTEEQQQAISNIYKLYNAGGPERVRPKTPADYVAHWAKARRASEPLLTAQQIKRVDEIALQRMSYRVFSVDRVVAALTLTAEQQLQITAAIQKHGQRLRSATLPADEAQRIWNGQLSHRKVWLDVRDVLSADQVELFNRLRGEKPKSAVARGRVEKVGVSSFRGGGAQQKPDMEEQLDQKVSLDFKGAPLLDVLGQVSRVFKLNLVVDRAAFDELGVSPQQLIFIHVESISLRNALNLMLGPYGLAAVVDREVVKITRRKASPTGESTHEEDQADEMKVPAVDARIKQEMDDKLDQKVSLRFANAPLKDVLRQISRDFNLNIVVDRRALAEHGISTQQQQQIFLDVDGVKLRSALKLILAPRGLAAEIQREVVKIAKKKTTKDQNELSDENQRGDANVPAVPKSGRPSNGMSGSSSEINQKAVLPGQVLKGRDQIGTAMGKPVYRDQIRPKGHSLRAELFRLFVGPVDQRFRRQNVKQLTPTDQEV